MFATKEVLGRIAIVAAVVVIATAGIGLTPVHARTLHYSTPAPPADDPANQALRWWANEVERRTDGKIEIEIHWLQSLIKYAEAAQGVSAGIADIAPMSPEYSQARLPLWSLSATTIGPGDPYIATEAWRRVRENSEALREEAHRFGLKYIAHFSSGGSPIWVSNTRPYLLPEDFQGDKVRFSARTASAAEIGDWPVTQVSLPFTAAYSALGRGTIDGTQFYLQHMIPYKLHEVSQYIVEPGLGQQTAVAMMNRRVWNSLSEEVQQVFTELSPLFSQRVARANIKELRRAREQLEASEDHPVEIYQLDQTKREVWKAPLKAAQQAFVEDMAERDPAATAIHERYMRALTEVEQEVEQHGYPWERD